MRRLFQGFLVMFGVIAIGISLAHLAVGPEAIIGGSTVNPTSDGEDRFYAGGIGRLVALIAVGPPTPFFVAMLVLELVLPPLMVLAARRVAQPAAAADYFPR